MDQDSRPLKTLLLAERSNRSDVEGSETSILHSPTRSRLDWCYPDWENAFVVRNVWSSKEDSRDGKERVREILREVQPDVVVSLGITVSLLLDIPYETPWLTATVSRGLRVVKFPHPSGRSRFWNDADDAEAAKKTLTGAAHGVLDFPTITRTERAEGTTPPSRSRTVEHETTVKYLKVEKTYIGQCTCGWAVASRTERGRDDEITFHMNGKIA